MIGEYATPTGDVVLIRAQPAVDDDTGHLHNWLHGEFLDRTVQFLHDLADRR